MPSAQHVLQIHAEADASGASEMSSMLADKLGDVAPASQHGLHMAEDVLHRSTQTKFVSVM